MSMLFKFLHKKNKREENLGEYSQYAFNLQEIEEFNKLGKDKIKKLNNKDIMPTTQKKESNESIKKETEIENITSENKQANDLESDITKDNIQSELKESEEETQQENNNILEEKIIDESIENITPKKKKEPQFSYINLKQDKQNIIMNSWKNVDIYKLNDDIKKGQDLLKHNYTISYCDDAYNFINEVRERYNIIIKYLIGFNNEKHGIYDKTTFGENSNDEWRYLDNYVKLLEKIKTIKKSTSR